MELIYEMNSTEYRVIFHEINLYIEPYQGIKYLFTFGSGTNIIGKRYLIDIDYNDIKNFVYECLILDRKEIPRNLFEITIIQLIDRYQTTLDVKLKIQINKRIGNLLLYNIPFKNFDYLKKIEKCFSTQSIGNDYDIKKNNLQLKYLLIMINNLVEIKINDLNLGKNYEDINLLEFAFDYYLT